MICFDQLKEEEKITPSGPVKLEIYPVNEVNSNAQDKCIISNICIRLYIYMISYRHEIEKAHIYKYIVHRLVSNNTSLRLQSGSAWPEYGDHQAHHSSSSRGALDRNCREIALRKDHISIAEKVANSFLPVFDRQSILN